MNGFRGIREEFREKIVQEAVARLPPVLYYEGSWIVDYVRIRIYARRE